MKAQINKNGILEIYPESETEIYALEKWHESNPDFSRDSKIWVCTEV